MQIDVEFDKGALRRHVRTWTRKQLPFAFATALNETVRDAQDELRDELPSTFTIRNDRTAKGVRTERATKTKLEAAVGSIDRFMGLQTTGGEKLPDKAKGVAVPVKARPRPTSKTTRSKWPGALKTKRGAFYVSRSSTTRGGAPHPLRPRGDVVLVFLRGGRGGSRLRLMYVIEKSVSVEPRWRLEETLATVARREWQTNMRTAWEKAMHTARRGSRRRR